MSGHANGLYREKGYWDERFEGEESYEWLAGYSEVRELIRRFVAREARVLIVGHGNSRLGVEMVEDGYSRVTNSDFSAVVIEKMRERYPNMHWIVADMLSLSTTFSESSFDVVLDKAAMDAIVTDEGDPWDPNEETREMVRTLCREARHVLRADGGRLIQISFQQPHFRKRLMTSPGLRLEALHDVHVGMGYFFYVWAASLAVGRHRRFAATALTKLTSL